MRFNRISAALFGFVFGTNKNGNGHDGPQTLTTDSTETDSSRSIMLIAFPNPLNGGQVNITGNRGGLSVMPMNLLAAKGIDWNKPVATSVFIRNVLYWFGFSRISFKALNGLNKRLEKNGSAHRINSWLTPAVILKDILNIEPEAPITLKSMKVAVCTALGYTTVKDSGIDKLAYAYARHMGVKVDRSFQVILANTGQSHPEMVNPKAINGRVFGLNGSKNVLEMVSQDEVTSIPDGYTCFYIDPASTVKAKNAVATAILEALAIGSVKTYRVGYNHEQLQDAAYEGGRILFAATWGKNITALHGNRSQFVTQVESIEKSYDTAAETLGKFSVMTTPAPNNGTESSTSTPSRTPALAAR